MKRVYIASPISTGDLYKNIQLGNETFWELQKLGFSPFVPVWSAFSNGPYINDKHEVVAVAVKGPRGTEGIDWIKIDLCWVAVSDCVLRLPGESRGADIEVFFAQCIEIPVFYSIEELLEWHNPKLLF